MSLLQMDSPSYDTYRLSSLLRSLGELSPRTDVMFMIVLSCRRVPTNYRFCMDYFPSIYFLSLISESCYHFNLPLTITLCFYLCLFFSLLSFVSFFKISLSLILSFLSFVFFTFVFWSQLSFVSCLFFFLFFFLSFCLCFFFFLWGVSFSSFVFCLLFFLPLCLSLCPFVFCFFCFSSSCLLSLRLFLLLSLPPCFFVSFALSVFCLLSLFGVFFFCL